MYLDVILFNVFGYIMLLEVLELLDNNFWFFDIECYGYV